MLILGISFESLHQILQDLYGEMVEFCVPISDVAIPLAALGALFFIAYRVWQSLARAEPIDVFALLRPFALGICILFFDTMVLGTINGIFDPIIKGTSAMLQQENFSLQEYQRQKDRLESEARLRNILNGGVVIEDKRFDEEIGRFE